MLKSTKITTSFTGHDITMSKKFSSKYLFGVKKVMNDKLDKIKTFMEKFNPKLVLISYVQFMWSRNTLQL